MPKWGDFYKQQFDKIMLGVLFLVLLPFTIWSYRWHVEQLSTWLTTTEGGIIGSLMTLITSDKNRNRTSDNQPLLPDSGGTK